MREESLAQVIEKERKKVKDFYTEFDIKDEELIKIEAKKYSDNIEIQNAFIEGYNFSIKQPSSKTIRIIIMYAYDYIPSYVKTNTQNAFKKIRELFREKLTNLV